MILLLTGCSVLQSKELFVGCRAADVGTTAYALRHGAYETNGFSSIGIILTVNIGVSALGWTAWDEMDDTAKTVLNIVSCAPVVNNINTIRDQRKENR